MNKECHKPLILILFSAALVTFSCQWGIKSGGEEDADGAEADIVIDHFIDTDADIQVDDGQEIPPECTTDEQCDDGDPCNGEETCNAAGSCEPGDMLPDGTACETPSGVGGTCRAGTCMPTTCGNGEVDDGEECDDGNDIPGDGCENNCTYSCDNAGDCSDDNVCTDDDCVPNDNGQVCRYDGNDNPCDDGLFCTIADQCDGDGNCIGSGDPCEDDLDCTVNESCNEDIDRCGYDIEDGACLIDGACWVDGDENPADECRECRSTVSIGDWSPKADMEECTDGICCDGACRVGGVCCTDADCPTAGCYGTALECGMIVDQVICESQMGCIWRLTGVGVCSGANACSSFTDVLEEMCTGCGCTAVGCGGGTCNCRGPGNPCSDFDNPVPCAVCGCTWDMAYECAGTHFDCSIYITMAECSGQLVCAWSGENCVDYTCQ